MIVRQLFILSSRYIDNLRTIKFTRLVWKRTYCKSKAWQLNRYRNLLAFCMPLWGMSRYIIQHDRRKYSIGQIELHLICRVSVQIWDTLLSNLCKLIAGGFRGSCIWRVALWYPCRDINYSHYFSQCWLRFTSAYCAVSPLWIDVAHIDNSPIESYPSAI